MGVLVSLSDVERSIQTTTVVPTCVFDLVELFNARFWRVLSSSSAFLFLCRYTRFSGDKLRKRPFSNPCHLCRAAVPFSRVDLMCAVFPCVQTPLTWSELPRGNGEIEPIPNTALSPPDQFCIKGGQPRVLHFRVSRHWYVAANAWDF